ncbi:MAG: 16S rRNA (cytosine(967)-C(5))-methyltransferase RsmB [Verrucomicrobia bacterium]|nr:16S rRNA (cytosine(967)-C(5))-methyltransferase RsmB [Verrucomicrobiota bacterium]
MVPEKPREIAFRVLHHWEKSNRFVESILEKELDEAPISSLDRKLAQELVYGAIRWRRTLDWIISGRTEDRPQHLAIRLLLRLGLYQMFWLDRIPDHAIVHETVQLAKRVGSATKAGFVNAILRGCLREQAAIEKALTELKTERPADGYSHPAWLFERWAARWGKDPTNQLMEWNNSPAKMYARVNLLRTTASRLVEEWQAEGVECKPFRRDWIGEELVFELKATADAAKLATFQKGCFYIQDPSTLLAVEALDPRPGEHLLDLCAAPGGKTILIAQKMQDQGQVVAGDIQKDRLALLRQNCARLGATCVETALSPLASRRSPFFDGILVDAPCSNTGVMRRRVDLRWRIRPEELERLRRAQLALLRDAAEGLKPGGRLVYSTCSLEPEENGDVVRDFLAERHQFNLEHERQLLPFVDGVDGAYVARLTKTAISAESGFRHSEFARPSGQEISEKSSCQQGTVGPNEIGSGPTTH